MLNGPIAKGLRLSSLSLSIAPSEQIDRERFDVLVNKTPKLIQNITAKFRSQTNQCMPNLLNQMQETQTRVLLEVSGAPPKKAVTIGSLLLQMSTVEPQGQGDNTQTQTNGGLLRRNLILKNLDRGTFNANRLRNFEDYDEIRRMQMQRHKDLDRMPIRVIPVPEMEKIRRDRESSRRTPNSILAKNPKFLGYPAGKPTDKPLLKKRLVFAQYNTVFIFARDG